MTDFKLTPAAAPPRVGRGRPAVYLQMVVDFVAMDEKSVRVDSSRKPDTIYNGLAGVVRKHSEFKGVKVTRRGDEVYMVRDK